MATKDILEALGTELDAESWQWLIEHHMHIADTIELAVGRGATPEQIRAFVIRRCGHHREEFARRCEAASRYLSTRRDA